MKEGQRASLKTESLYHDNLETLLGLWPRWKACGIAIAASQSQSEVGDHEQRVMITADGLPLRPKGKGSCERAVVSEDPLYRLSQLSYRLELPRVELDRMLKARHRVTCIDGTSSVLQQQQPIREGSPFQPTNGTCTGRVAQQKHNKGKELLHRANKSHPSRSVSSPIVYYSIKARVVLFGRNAVSSALSRHSRPTIYTVILTHFY